MTGSWTGSSAADERGITQIRMTNTAQAGTEQSGRGPSPRFLQSAIGNCQSAIISSFIIPHSSFVGLAPATLEFTASIALVTLSVTLWPNRNRHSTIANWQY